MTIPIIRRLSLVRWIMPFALAIGLVIAPLTVLAQPVTGRQLSIGIVPQQSASRLAEQWVPLLVEISKRSGVELVFRTAPNIPTFEQRLSTGEYDFAYMNPYHYVVFHKAVGYRAFAREQDRKIQGIVVVRKDSPYKSLAGLAGKSIAFPAPASFAASILTQAEFGRQNIAISSKFVTSHDSVYRAVITGLHEAGGGIQRTLEASPPEIREQLRVLSVTSAYTPHALAAHSRVPAETVARVLTAMQSLAGDEVGRNLLMPLAFTGIAAAQDKEWNDIRALDIKALERYSKE